MLKYEPIRNTLIAIIGVLFIGGTCQAQTYSLGLSTGSQMVAADGRIEWPTVAGDLGLGAGVWYRENDDEKHTIFNLKLTTGSESFFPGLQFEVGFNGILGSAKKDELGGNLGGVGFIFSTRYSFSEVYDHLPLVLLGEIFYVPEATTFLDMVNHLQISGGIGITLLQNAMIHLSYKYVNTEQLAFGTNWEVKDSIFYFGIRLMF